MQIINQPTGRSVLKDILPGYFGDMIKAVVDIKLNIVGIDAELHADIEQALIERGSSQYDLWGINLYPEMEGDDFVEFDSMINIRPSQGNRSRDVQDEKTRSKIIDIVNTLFK